MLLLKRKVNEKIELTDETTGAKVVLTVVQINKYTVKLGFDAPQNIKIMRTELNDPSENSGKEADLPSQPTE